ncbi:MAG: carboxyl transferase domain-containing protein [Eubacteriales bacterium]|nr:carboxyl transferase domain-containing protein [Eubacteriales bacterium]
MGKNEPLQQWEQKKQELQQGNSEKIKIQHDKGKKTARERIGLLFDTVSFVELEALNEDSGVICGYGLAENRPVFAVAQDVTVKGAAMSKAQAGKIIRTLDLAKKSGSPVVFFIDTEGFQVEENALALKAYGKVFAKMASLSGFCPTISLVSGNSFGVAAQFAAIADFTIVTEGISTMLPFSPAVMNTAGNVPKDAETLGGAKLLSIEGIAALVTASEEEAIGSTKKLLGLIPSSTSEEAPYVNSDDINRTITADGSSGLALADDIADKGTRLELYKDAGIGMHTSFARIGGHSCLLIVSEPINNNGRLCHKACKKISRLVDFADNYNLPVVSLVSSEGLKVVPEDKLPTLMANCAEMTNHISWASIPKVSVIYGNAIGASYISFVASANPDISFVWPHSMVAPLSKETAVQTFDALKLKSEKRSTLEAAYAKAHDGMSVAQLGLVDNIINPSETRKHIIAAIELLYTKDRAFQFD